MKRFLLIPMVGLSFMANAIGNDSDFSRADHVLGLDFQTNISEEVSADSFIESSMFPVFVSLEVDAKDLGDVKLAELKLSLAKMKYAFVRGENYKLSIGGELLNAEFKNLKDNSGEDGSLNLELVRLNVENMIKINDKVKINFKMFYAYGANSGRGKDILRLTPEELDMVLEIEKCNDCAYEEYGVPEETRKMGMEAALEYNRARLVFYAHKDSFTRKDLLSEKEDGSAQYVRSRYSQSTLGARVEYALVDGRKSSYSIHLYGQVELIKSSGLDTFYKFDGAEIQSQNNYNRNRGTKTEAKAGIRVKY